MEKKCFIGIIVICMAISVATDCAYAIDEVIIQSSTHSSPSTDTTIKVYFEYGNTAEIDGYYYTITTQSSHTITNESINTNDYIDLPNDLVSTRGDGPYSDGYYYLYIAAYDAVFLNPTVVGPTTRFGPMKVDTESPLFLNVTGPATTNTSKITLNLDSNEELSEVCISETGYGNCNNWQNLSASSIDYTLSSGPGDYLLFVHANDVAGNIEQTTSPFEVEYKETVIPVKAQAQSIPTLSQWGEFLLLSLLIIFALNSIRRQAYSSLRY
jgi:hypothetical protein